MKIHRIRNNTKNRTILDGNDIFPENKYLSTTFLTHRAYQTLISSLLYSLVHIFVSLLSLLAILWSDLQLLLRVSHATPLWWYPWNNEPHLELLLTSELQHDCLWVVVDIAKLLRGSSDIKYSHIFTSLSRIQCSACTIEIGCKIIFSDVHKYETDPVC